MKHLFRKLKDRPHTLRIVLCAVLLLFTLLLWSGGTLVGWAMVRFQDASITGLTLWLIGMFGGIPSAIVAMVGIFSTPDEYEEYMGKLSKEWFDGAN